VLTVFFRSLDESQLTSLGVFDGNHQRLILNKASSGITSDFENMLGDLNSVIKDLESFSVPTKVDTTVIPTNPAAPQSQIAQVGQLCSPHHWQCFHSLPLLSSSAEAKERLEG